MTRKEREIHTVAAMTSIYCRAHHDSHGQLCPECISLMEYVRERVDRCPQGDGKRSCRVCPIHCYRPEYREAIRRVMRYAGPRMMLYHPVMAIRHLIHER